MRGKQKKMGGGGSQTRKNPDSHHGPLGTENLFLWGEKKRKRGKQTWTAFQWERGQPGNRKQAEGINQTPPHLREGGGEEKVGGKSWPSLVGGTLQRTPRPETGGACTVVRGAKMPNRLGSHRCQGTLKNVKRGRKKEPTRSRKKNAI